ALLSAGAAAGGWLGVLLFLLRTPFGVTDPVFGRDIGYYVFTVPVVASAIGLVTMLAALALTAVVLLYLVRRDVVVFRRQVTVEPSARVHLAGLIALLFLLTALRVYFVGLPGLLYSTTGPLVGASYSDLHAELIGQRLVALAALAGGALVLWGATSHRLARNTPVAVGVAPDADLHQRTAHLHARDGTHPRAGEPGDAGGTAGPLHQGSAAGVQRVAARDAPGDLLRRAD